MENFQTIIESIQGTIKIVTYNKPKRKNAIDIDMYKRVTKILHDCANDSTVSMMVFTGAGDYFSSGNDLVAARTVHTPSFLQVLHDFIEAFITFPKLLVAVVNGPAVGIAVTTLPLCDLVFAAENAFFYTPFGKLGFTAEGCSSYTFPRIIGHGKALEMLLFDQKMNAKEAFDYGLVNYVYKPEEIQSQVWNKLTEISNVSNDLVTTTKRLIRSSIQDKLLKVNDEEIRLLNEAWAVRNQKQDGCTIKKDFYNRFSTDPVRGMSRDKAAELLKFYGHNALTPPTQNGWTKVLFKSMCTGFSVLIWLGALLCLGAYLIEASSKPNPSRDNLYLGCVLIAVDVICGLFSFFQNYKSSQIMKTFNNMIPTYAQCTRDGVLQAETNVRDLVRGDLVRVQAGNIVPGDIRIIDSKGFKVDNSSLTGESVAVCRSNSEGTANILESPNVAFFSTQCVEGWAIGIVMCTGDLTALGRVAGLATRIQPKPSPLSREISRFMRYMSIWAICLGTFVACASLALGYPFMQTTIFVIGIIVANIPEGLQPTVTASLTLTAQRMVKKNCLIKNLDAIEALGACTTICSDKTGTLTENKMCVLDVWTWNKIQTVSRTSFHNMLRNSQAHAALIRCGALCSTATLKPDGTIHGDASETAILNFINKHGDLGVLRKQYPKVAEIPFNSAHKYQVTVHLDISNSKYIVMMKGAPEIIISRCETVAIDKDTKTLSKEMKLMADTASINMAKTGQRILALADLVLDARTYPLGYKFDTEDVNFPVDKLRLLGVFGLMDPPRKEVLSAIQRVRAAGVRVMMVTGDHPETARAVAHDVGIATAACHVVTGADLRGMTPDLLDWTIDKYYELDVICYKIFIECRRVGGMRMRAWHSLIFLGAQGSSSGDSRSQQAREHSTRLCREITAHLNSLGGAVKTVEQWQKKLQIVEACQRRGGIVAVTGDGVNDAPALRRADIGISMGITGSQVSKQTADIILMDDNFATIVTGIEEGRKIFDNLKKSICYILISNVPEIFPVLMFILFSIPLPLGVMTILCVDLGTDMWPAVSLAYERAESDVMARPPRRGEKLVTGRMIRLAYGHLGLLEVAAGMFAYFVLMAEHGFYPDILFGLRADWDNEAVSDLKDSLGQEWTYAGRMQVQRAAQAAYFVAVVMMQMMNGVVSKTRYNSIVHVGMKNKVLNMGLAVELLVACLVCYCPGINTFFKAYPLRIEWWFLAVPFVVFMFIFDEFRRYCIRRELFGGWFNMLTYY